MDLQICLEKLQRVGVLNFATVDKDGAPQIRNISAIHYERDGLYFFTARGKDFCGQLLHDGRVQILGYKILGSDPAFGEGIPGGGGRAGEVD